MYYKIIISNITSHTFYLESGILPMHRIVCDTYNELTGEAKKQDVVLSPGPEREWVEIQKNGYVMRYREEEMSDAPKPGFHYRYIAVSTITLKGNRIYSVAVPSPIHYQTPAMAKQDNTTFRFLKVNGVVYLCVFGKNEDCKAEMLHPELRRYSPKLIAAYNYDDFKKLPFIEWQKVKEGVDTFWLDADSFEECEETFDKVFTDMPDQGDVSDLVIRDTELVGDEAYSIEEEADDIS